MQTNPKSNRFTFGIGTLGRDMVYSLFSMFHIFYLTDVLDLPTHVLGILLGIIVGARVFDAVTDPVMGVIVDNTKTRWGKFKPWIAVGTIASPILTVLLFSDISALATPIYIILFTVIYLLWGIAFTTHDISYWSMLPSLSVNQKEREKIGSIARICANIGLFFVVAAIVPITHALSDSVGGLSEAYFVFAIGVSVIMAIGMCITLFGVKEPKVVAAPQPRTSLKEMLRIIYKNDQLLAVVIAMSLFMIGYITTVTFGIYFFTYDFGDADMFPIFSVILGVSQLGALAVFPLLTKRFKRQSLFIMAMGLVAAGYVVFFMSPTGYAFSIIFIGIAGMLLFVGQAFMQVLMLMFLTDSVDYGHWKLGKRNESVSFSLQPFINKMGGAVGTGIVGAVLIISGIQDADTYADVTREGLLIMRGAMLILPLILIGISFFILRAKYKIDEDFHKGIMDELRERGEITKD
ncbi:MAG: glycoside-pentoside-hexuronide (GPH):cation symporter [Defluviitaleaceae bacterium]|nr:glycoside-pentoside-hexuronide (GPH):cation symporter [Defluviitaleaceae bacterium]